MKKFAAAAAAAGIFVSTVISAHVPQKDSLINMPWQSTVSRDLNTGSAEQLFEQDLEHVPVSDIRKKLKGQLTSLEVFENCGGLIQSGVMTSPFINSDQLSISSRCFWTVACIIDDVPVPLNQYLIDPNQIESITMVTDIADKVALGTVASKGAVFIRTKKGGYNTPLRITADLESGFETPGVWPEYVNAEQFATLSNIAREQSGYNQLYSSEDIAGYANGSAFDIRYPNVDYRSLFFNKMKPVSRVSFNANAGSRAVKFNVSLNGVTGPELIKIGPKTDYSKLNLSTSVSARIGQYLEANVSFNGLLSVMRGGNGGSFWEANDTPALAFPLTLYVDPESEYYDPSVMEGNVTVYGISRIYDSNPYAAQLENGYYNSKRRSGMFNATLDFDMSWLLPGLKSKTFVNIDTFHSINIGKSEDYLAYYWDPKTIIDGRSSEHLGNKSAAEAVIDNATFQSMNFYERLTWDWNKGAHRINSSATFSMLSAASNAKNTNTRMMSGAGTVKYSLKDRYVLDLVANYTGTTVFDPGKKFCFNPAAGFAWVASKESFLKDSRWLDYLKFRTQVGRIGDLDIFGTSDNIAKSVYRNEESDWLFFGPLKGASWIGQLTDPMINTILSRVANEDLTWPRIFQVDAGVDASLFNCLDAKFNYYWARLSGTISNVSPQYSKALGYSSGAAATEQYVGMYANYSQYLYKGWELSLNYHKDWNDFGFNVGGILRHWDLVNEIVTNDFYVNEYQKQSGRHASENYGFVYDGRFTSQEEIDNSPLYDKDTRIGDIKYKDLNGDGKIDAQDKMFLSPGNAKLRYAVNIDLRYKNFDLSVVGNGMAFFQTYLSSTYFMGGYGDSNYSKFIWDSLCDENGNPSAVGSTYPRLTYIRNSGNLSCSEYWLRDGGWFKIQSMELGYTAPCKKIKWLESVKLSLRASNLLTVTGLEYIDPEAPVSGIQASPLYKAYTAGLKFVF